MRLALRIILGSLVFICLVAIYFPNYSKIRDLAEKRKKLRSRIEETQERMIQLEEENRRLEEDPVYCERVLREKTGMVREGEIVHELSR